MTTYWNLTAEQQKAAEAKGVDYDLANCIDYHIKEFDILQVVEVLAVWEGENDGDDWRWILKLTTECGAKNGGEYAFIQGGCDYTGWDCQSWGKATFKSSPMEAAELAKTGPEGATGEEAIIGMGLGRLISVFSGSYMDNVNEVYDKLVKQLEAGKNVTWREQTRADLNLGDLPLIK